MVGYTVEPASPARLDQAVCLLLGLDPRTDAHSQRAERFHDWMKRQGLRPIYQALWRRRPVAAATVMANPGRTGMLVHSPCWVCRTRKTALIQAIRVASQNALDSGLAFVQTLISPQDEQTRPLLERAGYVRLTELIYMRLGLSAGAPPARNDLEWRGAPEPPQAVLESTIAATYEDSLDCPALAGLRSLSDVVEGHRSSGLFRPEWWWVAFCNGQPAGCVLVNDVASTNRADIVYLGVAKAWRRHGIGQALLGRAARLAKQAGKSALTLAVDAANTPAIALYDGYGFERTDRRLAMVYLAKS
jgi:ribosomal protein S18 acetylase RimI-like enzyme